MDGLYGTFATVKWFGELFFTITGKVVIT